MHTIRLVYEMAKVESNESRLPLVYYYYSTTLDGREGGGKRSVVAASLFGLGIGGGRSRKGTKRRGVAYRRERNINPLLQMVLSPIWPPTERTPTPLKGGEGDGGWVGKRESSWRGEKGKDGARPCSFFSGSHGAPGTKCENWSFEVYFLRTYHTLTYAYT